MIIVETEFYKYASFVFACSFLLPQIYSGYKTKSLRDVSGFSIAGCMWAFYLYEIELIYYTIATIFVCLNALIVFTMKIWFYYSRVNEHLKTLDAPPQPLFSCPHCNSLQKDAPDV